MPRHGVLAGGKVGVSSPSHISLRGVEGRPRPSGTILSSANLPHFNPAAADSGWRNGVWVANGNLVPRHLGIPTVTVPMGIMADIGMPVGLTIAGRAYDDTALLSLAAAFEATGARRTPPPRTPPL